MTLRDGPRRIGDEETDMIARDLMTALSGRIESGLVFGIVADVGGGLEARGNG